MMDACVEEGLYGLFRADCKSKSVNFSSSIMKCCLSGLDKAHHLPRAFYVHYEEWLMSLPAPVTIEKGLIRYCL